MDRLRDPLFALIIYILGFLVISLLFYFWLKTETSSTLDYISMMGTYSSVYGIFIAYAQILSVREISKSTETKIEDANDRVMKILSVSDLSKAIKIVHEVQNYLITDKDEASIIRLKDLKSILIQLKYNSEIGQLASTDEFSDLLVNVSIHMENLNHNIIGTKSGLNKGKIISDLEVIENKLSDFEGQLKFGNNG